MTTRLRNTVPFADHEKYATLLAEALRAFEQDIRYAVQLAESAHALSTKGRKAKIKIRS